MEDKDAHGLAVMRFDGAGRIEVCSPGQDRPLRTFEVIAIKIAGGLAVIGAVVAEFVAGTAGQSTGLASRILESSFRNEIPRMFAALFLVSLLGILIFPIAAWLTRAVLGHWHGGSGAARLWHGRSDPREERGGGS